MANKYFTDESLAALVNNTKTYTNDSVDALSNEVVHISTTNEDVEVELVDILTVGNIANNLTTTADAMVLSANQGKVLDEKIALLSEQIATLTAQIAEIQNSSNYSNPTMTVGTETPDDSTGSDGDIYVQVVEE